MYGMWPSSALISNVPQSAALTAAPHMRTGSELDVAAREPDEFGDSQPCLDGDDEQCVIAAADPGGAVRAGRQRVDLGRGQERDQANQLQHLRPLMQD